MQDELECVTACQKARQVCLTTAAVPPGFAANRCSCLPSLLTTCPCLLPLPVCICVHFTQPLLLGAEGLSLRSGGCDELSEARRDALQRDEARLAQLGRRSVEMFALAHIFTEQLEVRGVGRRFGCACCSIACSPGCSGSRPAGRGLH